MKARLALISAVALSAAAGVVWVEAVDHRSQPHRAALLGGAEAEPVPVGWEARALEVQAGSQGELELLLRIPPGFDIYESSVEVDLESSVAGLSLGEVRLPLQAPEEDGRVHLRGAVPVRVGLSAAPEAGGLHELPLRLRTRGCSATGCLPRGETLLAALVHVAGPAAPAATPAAARRAARPVPPRSASSGAR